MSKSEEKKSKLVQKEGKDYWLKPCPLHSDKTELLKELAEDIMELMRVLGWKNYELKHPHYQLKVKSD